MNIRELKQYFAALVGANDEFAGLIFAVNEAHAISRLNGKSGVQLLVTFPSSEVVGPADNGVQAHSLLVMVLLLRLCSGPSVVVKEKTTTDTVTIVKIDTVVIEKPVPVRVIEKRTDTLTVYRDGDTILVPIPILQYSFQDSLYSLDVSGYHVSVDRLEVYPRTIYKTVTTNTVRTEKDNRRFGIGIQAGYGYNFGTGKLTPYIGIGVQYSLWRF